jgi:hypothetical protein
MCSLGLLVQSPFLRYILHRGVSNLILSYTVNSSLVSFCMTPIYLILCSESVATMCFLRQVNFTITDFAVYLTPLNVWILGDHAGGGRSGVAEPRLTL